MVAIYPIAKQFVLQTRLFQNVLESVGENYGSERMNEHVNHLQWIAGHLANSRYWLASMAGLKNAFPYYEAYTDFSAPPPHNRAISPSVKYPTLMEIKKSWNELAAPFNEKISALTNEFLSAEAPVAVPTGKTLLDLFAFVASHESYHIGQMSLIRKYVGLPAMSYN